MSFPCDQCGLCCKAASKIGLPTKEDGSCIYLEDNKCSIYNTRPDICNIDTLFEVIDHGLTKEEWYKINQKSCEDIKR
jgi:Fe-S-cluster containining protein